MSARGKLTLLVTPLVTAAAISTPVLAADLTALKACMAEMAGEMGLSPDLAYKECKKKSITNCITSLRGKFVTLTATSKNNKGYVVDLGNDKKLWQEGRFWSDRGCKVIKNGGSITQNAPDKNGFLQRYRWFRQGICQTETIPGYEYTDQLAFQACDPGGYVVDSGRNETDKSNVEQLMRGE
ncbi:hypothetical protein [Synechococcus sp. LTW-R]|uniref:hypothetical protein n=1 Tax=Synechococcus sp. LTW-R TaxID=2751170 RepID=UPI00162A4BFF|nr:hypothetical protein [Synechococcus sp. LTW-R]QNG28558.1 hypothetical protein H0O22_07095 [Synechococcus sp. LTW-R]